jgi:hypothetical protein
MKVARDEVTRLSGGARLHTCVEQQQQRLHTGPAGIQSELDQSAVATIRFTEIRRRNPLTRTILEYLHTYLGELASQRGRRKRMTRSSASCLRQ